MTCECCGSAATVPTKYTNVFQFGPSLVQCCGCGVKFYDRPAHVLPPAFYGGPAYDTYAHKDDTMGSPSNDNPATAAYIERVKSNLYRGYLDRLAQIATPLFALYEVGFGVGRFLAEARTRGIETHGCDMNTVDVELGRATGADVALAAFQDATVPTYLDAVVMLDVIEHTLTPRADIEKACRHLRPGGALLLKTFYDEWHETLAGLDVASPRNAKIEGRKTGYFCPVSHPYHFDESALRGLIERCGFDIVGWDREEVHGQITAWAVKAGEARAS